MSIGRRVGYLNSTGDKNVGIGWWITTQEGPTNSVMISADTMRYSSVGDKNITVGYQ